MNFMKLAGVAIGVLLVSFGPFIYFGILIYSHRSIRAVV